MGVGSKIEKIAVFVLVVAFFTLFSNLAIASAQTTIRLGVLASGTLTWELAAMQHQNLLENAGLVKLLKDIGKMS